MKKVTILLPAYNEEASFPLIAKCMEKVVRDNSNYEWEFLMVNDGSTDNTLQQMVKLHQMDSRYNYIDLSRNYGKEVAMMAGFDYATGDAVIIMDDDMQHPIDVIPEMLKYWEEGYENVTQKLTDIGFKVIETQNELDAAKGTLSEMQENAVKLQEAIDAAKGKTKRDELDKELQSVNDQIKAQEQVINTLENTHR